MIDETSKNRKQYEIRINYRIISLMIVCVPIFIFIALKSHTKSAPSINKDKSSSSTSINNSSLDQSAPSTSTNTSNSSNSINNSNTNQSNNTLDSENQKYQDALKKAQEDVINSQKAVDAANALVQQTNDAANAMAQQANQISQQNTNYSSNNIINNQANNSNSNLDQYTYQSQTTVPDCSIYGSQYSQLLHQEFIINVKINEAKKTASSSGNYYGTTASQAQSGLNNLLNQYNSELNNVQSQINSLKSQYPQC
jgi:hypothetical protein